MKKRMQVLPLLLTIALLFSSVVSFPAYAEDTDKTLVKDTEQRSDWQGKLYPESFIGEYEQAGENDVFTVWVWVKDKTEKHDVARMVYEETGLNAGNITSVSEEEYQAELETWTEDDEKLLSKEAPEYSKRAMLESRIQQRKTAEYLSALRRIEKEITSISNNDILKTLDLKEDEILYVSTDAPVMALSLSKSEIERIAQYKDVNSIEHVGGLSDIKQYGSDPSEKDTYTYYFLAPDEYIGSDGSVGAYWWTPEETAEYPGVGMKRESDIGENVFSVKVPSTTTAITFNAYITPESNNSSDYDHYDTVNIDLSGYKKARMPTMEVVRTTMRSEPIILTAGYSLLTTTIRSRISYQIITSIRARGLHSKITKAAIIISRISSMMIRVNKRRTVTQIHIIS